MTHNAADTARSGHVTNETRGQELKARRLALGIKSVREFAEASGIDRGALSKAEAGQASPATYDRAEAWLRGMEEETGHDEPSSEPLRFTFRDVYGVGEIIAEGPVDRPDELIAAVAKMLAEIRNQGEK